MKYYELFGYTKENQANGFANMKSYFPQKKAAIKMTNERAIEILDPEHREHYESIETVNEACRMGMEALKFVEMTDEEIENLYHIKLSKYIEQGIEVSDELDDALYEEAIREAAAITYINERGRLNGLHRKSIKRTV